VDFQVRITEEALIELEEIAEYSWRHFPVSTSSFMNGLLDHVEQLGRFPYMGYPVQEWRSVRQLIHTPILIYYSVQTNPNVVEVLRFWNALQGPFPF
jgi:plasmid stabilization system protein ParE